MVKENFFASKDQTLLPRCVMCRAELKNPDSQEAGMGLVCLARTRFIESFNPESLDSFKGKPVKTFGDLNLSTVLIRNDEHGRFSLNTILSNASNQVIAFDRLVFNSAYAQNSSFTAALEKALVVKKRKDVRDVYYVANPSDTQYGSYYESFVRNNKNLVKERRKKISENNSAAAMGLGFSVSKVAELTEEQKTERSKLLLGKVVNPAYYVKHWDNGEFHLATIVSRLDRINLNEAYELKNAFISAGIEVEIKDYGLLDDEIASGLSSSARIDERYLFEIFLNKSPLIDECVDLYLASRSSSIQDRFRVRRLLKKAALRYREPDSVEA